MADPVAGRTRAAAKDPAGASVPTALHGQFVVSDGHGGFTTELTQTGTVTDITDTAITARSDDGFTQTYVVTTDTRQARTPVQTGDTATIRATSDERPQHRDGDLAATLILALMEADQFQYCNQSTVAKAVNAVA